MSSIIYINTKVSLRILTLYIGRDFNEGLGEAELMLVVKNLAHFHAASMALSRTLRLDLEEHYGPLFNIKVTEKQGKYNLY